jgi:hypothetical protein
MNLTKSEKKQIDRASVMGRGAMLRTMAIIHRAGSSRTQKAIEHAIDESDAWPDFARVNGALLHNSEV